MRAGIRGFLVGGVVVLLPLLGAVAAAQSKGSKAHMYAISREQAEAVFALLPPVGSPLGATGLSVDSVQINRDRVDACFGSQQSESRCVTLIHPSAAAAGELRTKHFAVRVVAPATPELARDVAATVMANETTSPWSEISAPPPGKRALGREGPGRRGLYVVIVLVAAFLALGWYLARRRKRAG